MAKNAVLYQLKVIVNHIKPLIWRRIVVPGNLNLWQLHTVLQVAMGWTESHLHAFKIQGSEYGDPQNDDTGIHPIKDEHAFRLDRVIPRQIGFRFTYTYDFGDDWEHVLLVEKVVPHEGSATYPVCLAGKRAGPIEDSGGPPGYMSLLEAIKDPTNAENEELLDWLGEAFDPEFFDLDDTNQQLAVLAENDYQIEELFADEDEDEDDEEDELAELFGEEDPSLMLGSVDDFVEVFGKWSANLPEELQQACQDMHLRRNLLTLLIYLRDHKVKGTTATGNMPLKAVREINAGFVEPLPLDVEGFSLRTEDQVPDLLFLHTLAYARGLLDGGPGERWELTEEGRLFLELSPTVQAMDIFLGWLFQMPWESFSLFVTPKNEMVETRKAIIRTLAARSDRPAGTWLSYNLLSKEMLAATGWTVNENYVSQEITFEKLIDISIFSQLLLPMLDFEMIEMSGSGMESLEYRFTPLGASLMGAVKEFIK